MRKIFGFVVLTLFAAACANKVTTTTGSTGSSGSKYSEDLSAIRPRPIVDTTKHKEPVKTDGTKRNPSVYLEARHAVNQNLDAVLDSIDRINLSNGLVDGFTIQLYSGIHRDEALNVKKQIATAMPDLDADLQFVQPNFRVRAGKYFNRFEAQKDFVAVKKLFPNAVIIPERIAIR